MTRPEFATPVSGPSYSPAMRGVAIVALIGILLLVARSWDVIAVAGWTSPGALVYAGAFLGLAGSTFFMLRSTTTIDEKGIRQTGLMEKKVEWSEVRMARVARWGAARLIVKAERGPFTVFYGGSGELRAAFARVAGALGH